MKDAAELPSRESVAETGAPRILKVIERGMLILVGGLTVLAAGLELAAIVENRAVSLADILLMFLYTEVIGMVAVFYTSRTIVVIYPIFIAITALARLIVLQGKDMDPLNIVFEAAAILVLAVAVLILGRRRSTD
jgi:protein PsiE